MPRERLDLPAVRVWTLPRILYTAACAAAFVGVVRVLVWIGGGL